MRLLIDHLLVTLQRLTPRRLLSRLTGWVANSGFSPLKNLLTWVFLRLYDLNLEEAEQPDAYAYPTFNAFFTRALKPGVRPLASGPGVVVSPVDGKVSQCGTIHQNTLIQAKNHNYDVRRLLGTEDNRFDGGVFITIYLAPYNYHRVHVPVECQLQAMTYVPGHLYSVGDATTRALPGLFARNERVVFDLRDAGGHFALVMVGAMNVGSITTVHAGNIMPTQPRQQRRWAYENCPDYPLGAELARFDLGSTVIVLFPAGRLQLNPSIEAGSLVSLGQEIGRLN